MSNPQAPGQPTAGLIVLCDFGENPAPPTDPGTGGAQKPPAKPGLLAPIWRPC